MYSGYFLQRGRVAQGCNLNVTTLDAAIVMCRKILHEQMDIDRLVAKVRLDDYGLLILLNNFGPDGTSATGLTIWVAYVAGRARCCYRKTSFIIAWPARKFRHPCHTILFRGGT